MGYYGDAHALRFRGRFYYGDPGFSFKKLGRFLGKVAKPLLKVAAPIVSAVVPGGQFLSGILGGAGKFVQAAKQTVEPFMPLYSAIADVRRGEVPGAGMSRTLASAVGIGTPGGVAAVEARSRAVRRVNRYKRYRRPARRRGRR
jgi:hypothetical protein